MRYGQLQYYDDELKQWLRTVPFLALELQESLRQLNVILTFPVVSLPDAKATTTLVNLLAVQQQRFNKITKQIADQRQSLNSAIVTTHDTETAILVKQTSLRLKMRRYELSFLKTKYESAILLSAFFEMGSVPVRG